MVYHINTISYTYKNFQKHFHQIPIPYILAMPMLSVASVTVVLTVLIRVASAVEEWKRMTTNINKTSMAHYKMKTCNKKCEEAIDLSRPIILFSIEVEGCESTEGGFEEKKSRKRNRKEEKVCIDGVKKIPNKRTTINKSRKK